MKPPAPTDTRRDFPHLAEIQTRWDDNDVYGHVNNVVYYAYFDTVINRYLIDHGLKLDGEAIGVCVESGCRYLREIAFPEPIEAGLRVESLGTSSVRYEIGIFRGEELCALGHFVHVFVDSASRKPVVIPETIRAGLNALRGAQR
ncbi:MAG: acyl-CoA thioesterase [Myxococcales bacterium]|nr:acyl-CoA thioesterase [Myxococcales bacterium]